MSQFGSPQGSPKRKSSYKDSIKRAIMKKAKVKHHKASIYTDLVKPKKEDKNKTKLRLAGDSNCVGFAAFLKKEYLGFDMDYDQRTEIYMNCMIINMV